jgi:hypothetical protein
MGRLVNKTLAPPAARSSAPQDGGLWLAVSSLTVARTLAHKLLDMRLASSINTQKYSLQ